MPRGQLYTTYSIEPAMVVLFKPSHILDAAQVAEMTDSLKDLAQHAREDKFVFDLSRVGYLSSSALGMFIGLQREFARKGRDMKLAGVSPENREVFRITRLDRVFDMHDDVKAALQAFRKAP